MIVVIFGKSLENNTPPIWHSNLKDFIGIKKVWNKTHSTRTNLAGRYVNFKSNNYWPTSKV